MLPILYESNETTFIHNGIGVLEETLEAVATEELNGMFELHVKYDINGKFAKEIKNERIIKAKANDTQDEQLFRIYSVTKDHDTQSLIIDAEHITYDLNKNFVEKMVASNLTKKQVMQQIQHNMLYPTRFNLSSSNDTTRSSTVLERTNPLQMVAGMDGSVLQFWGGQIERDNFNLFMHDRRGSNNNVKIMYAKNLTGLEAKFDMSSVITRIYPYKIINEDDKEIVLTIADKFVDSPLINKYAMPFVVPIDYSSDESITDRASLTRVSKLFFNTESKDLPKLEMTVRFEPLWHTEEYKDLAVLELVGMGDTVAVEHSIFEIEAEAIVNRIEYDVLAEKNNAVDLGNVKASMTDRLNSTDSKLGSIANSVNKIDSKANQAIISANGKNTNYYGPDEPIGDLIQGDTWFKVVEGQYTKTYRYDGIQWQLIIDMDTSEAKKTSDEAKKVASDARERVEVINQVANQSLDKAQESFDKAESAISISDEALQSSLDVKVIAEGLQVSIEDKANKSELTSLSDAFSLSLTNLETGVNASILATSQSLTSKISELEYSDRNLVINSDWSESVILTYFIKGYDLSVDWIVGETYTVVIKGRISSGQKFGVWANGSSTRVGYAEDVGGGYYLGKILLDKTPTINGTNSGIKKLNLFNYPNNAGKVSADIEWIKLVKGNINTKEWSSAPEDKADQSYVSSQISQLQNNINLAVKKNNIINEINISTEGILIAGKKLHITADAYIDNAVIQSANIVSLEAGKLSVGTLDGHKLVGGEVIGGTITSTKSPVEFTQITGGRIRSEGEFTRTFAGGRRATYRAYTESFNGNYRSGLISKTANGNILGGITRWTVLSDKGLTTQQSVHSGSDDYNGARFIDFFADETLTSNVHGQGMHIYSGQNMLVESQFRTTITSGKDWYTHIEGAGLRVNANGMVLNLRRDTAFTPTVGVGGNYISIQSFDNAEHGILGITSNNYDLQLATIFGDYVKLRSRNGTHVRDQIGLTYKPLTASNLIATDSELDLMFGRVYNDKGITYVQGNSDIYATKYKSGQWVPVWAEEFNVRGVGRLANIAGDTYVQGNLEVRTTKYNSGVYVPTRSSDFIKVSSIAHKSHFKEIDYSSLDIINDLNVIEYYLKDDLNNRNYTNKQIGVISELSQEIASNDGKGISDYKHMSHLTRAVQELSKIKDLHKSDIQAIYEVLGVLIDDIKTIKGAA